MQWLEIGAKDFFKKYKLPDKAVAFNPKSLRKVFEDSDKGLEDLLSRIWDDGGQVKGFRKGVIPILGYFISHESHHRGNMLLTLNQSGEKFPDTVKRGLWDWRK